MRSATYRLEIDGLRAIAVLAVILFHSKLGFNGGYLGVDVFFVISGYLITALILRDLERGQFRLAAFWERRIRRIFPALAVVSLACIVAGWLLFLPAEFKELGQSLIAQTFLLSNVYFWRESGYFDASAELKPLLHCWSLAVEEQFYLLYPLLLAWLWMRRNGPRFIWLILSVISCASIATNIYLGQAHPAAAFYLLPSRAWELLLGGLVALAPAISSQYPRWITESAAWLGIAAILGTVCLCDETMRFPFAGSLLSCLGTAAFLHANTPRLTSAGRILAWGPFTYVGAISYSLYLWHWPLLVYARYWSLGELRLEQKLGLIAICFALAVVTWKFVETPFRRGVLSGRKRIVWTAIAVSVGFALVGSILYSSAGDGG